MIGLLMRWTQLAALVLTILSANGSAAAGELRDHVLVSQTMPQPLRYRTYHPSGVPPGTQLPVLYLLHGAGGDETSWSEKGLLAATADRLIRDNKIKPVLIVIPGTRDCWWVDTPRCNMETAFWSELEPRISQRADVIPGPEARAIAGASAGGFAALRYALTRPERFAAAAVLSPAIYTSAPPEFSQVRKQAAFVDFRGKFDLALWQSLNYPKLLGGYAAQQARVPFHIASGDRDEYGLAFEAAELHRQLTSLQPGKVQLRIQDGTHAWNYWSVAIEEALIYLDRHLPAPTQPAADRYSGRMGLTWPTRAGRDQR